MTRTEDDQMVAAVLKGHADAFGDLVRKYEKPIFNLMFRATGSWDRAEDLTQEAFLKAYDKIHTYRRGRKFYSWLYALALNVARDEHRKSRRQPETAPLDPETAARIPAAAPKHADEVRSLFQILRTLPIRDREAVLLRFRDGLKMKEIAARLDLTVSGAKMRVHRGLAKLQQAWEDMGNEN
jgi:RNA polymerase sigma-70 factor (ECF subfamily)